MPRAGKKPAEGEVPKVVVKVDESRFVRKLIVEKCPFCGHGHAHGGGESSGPVTGLGVVSAGCFLGYNRGAADGEYELVLGGLEGAG